MSSINMYLLLHMQMSVLCCYNIAILVLYVIRAVEQLMP